MDRKRTMVQPALVLGVLLVVAGLTLRILGVGSLVWIVLSIEVLAAALLWRRARNRARRRQEPTKADFRRGPVMPVVIVAVLVALLLATVAVAVLVFQNGSDAPPGVTPSPPAQGSDDSLGKQLGDAMSGMGSLLVGVAAVATVVLNRREQRGRAGKHRA